jgi:hypothetical protein
VVWDEAAGAWAVRVALKEGDAPTQLGTFASAAEAAREHDAIVLDLFGPGAATNFPPAPHGAFRDRMHALVSCAHCTLR